MLLLFFLISIPNIAFIVTENPTFSSRGFIELDIPLTTTTCTVIDTLPPYMPI
jgi:hypothetical protein